jgi:hypothetical protein
MLGRIDPVLSAGKNRDRTGCDASAMRSGIDTTGETGRDSKSRCAQAARQLLGDFHPGRGCITRANDRDQRQGKHARLAADRDQRRRIVDHLQPARIIGFAEYDH